MLLAYSAFTLGLFSPGPNILSVIGTSMGAGRTFGKALALGVASGSFLWGLLTLCGLTSVLTVYASVMTGVKIVGAVYLLWLAFKAFRSAFSSENTDITEINVNGGVGDYYRRGLLVQMTNPKAALTWIAIMSLAIDENAPFWVGISVVAGTTIISMIGHLTYATAFSTTPMVEAYRRLRRSIELTLGAFFCFASYKLLTTKT